MSLGRGTLQSSRRLSNGIKVECGNVPVTHLEIPRRDEVVRIGSIAEGCGDVQGRSYVCAGIQNVVGVDSDCRVGV